MEQNSSNFESIKYVHWAQARSCEGTHACAKIPISRVFLFFWYSEKHEFAGKNIPYAQDAVLVCIPYAQDAVLVCIPYDQDAVLVCIPYAQDDIVRIAYHRSR